MKALPPKPSPTRIVESDEYYTPPAFLAALEAEFGALWDPCPPGARDGLIRPWEARVFCNPPWRHRRIEKWLAKGLGEMRAGRVELIVWLLPSATDTGWFHDLLYPNSEEIRFLRGRLRFVRRDQSLDWEPRSPHLVAIMRRGALDGDPLEADR